MNCPVCNIEFKPNTGCKDHLWIFANPSGYRLIYNQIVFEYYNKDNKYYIFISKPYFIDKLTPKFSDVYISPDKAFSILKNFQLFI